ncbi:hypothetical protein V6N13_099641 [Hibiscus sabdariffa]
MQPTVVIQNGALVPTNVQGNVTNSCPISTPNQLAIDTNVTQDVSSGSCGVQDSFDRLPAAQDFEPAAQNYAVELPQQTELSYSTEHQNSIHLLPQPAVVPLSIQNPSSFNSASSSCEGSSDDQASKSKENRGTHHM